MNTDCGAARRLLLDRSAPARFHVKRSSAERHVSNCPACRQFQAESEATVKLTKESLSATAPDEFRERLFEAVATARTRVAGTPRKPLAPYIAAALIAASVVGLLLGRSFSSQPALDTTLATIVADHALTAGDERIESSSARQVEEWLAVRVAHAVMVPTLTGAAVVGARTSGTPQGRGAVVEYEIDGRRVSYFILAAPSGAAIDGGVRLSAAKGYSIAHWQDRGLVHAFVGALPADRVKLLAEECIHQAESRLAAAHPSRMAKTEARSA